MRLDKKVAIVSGGAGGIGSGIVRRMAIEGAHVLVADIVMEGAQSVATEIGNQASAVYFDAYDQKSVEAMIQTAIDRYRSEEHTSELQSLMRNSYAVVCLNKKKPEK